MENPNGVKPLDMVKKPQTISFLKRGIFFGIGDLVFLSLWYLTTFDAGMNNCR